MLAIQIAVGIALAVVLIWILKTLYILVCLGSVWIYAKILYRRKRKQSSKFFDLNQKGYMDR